MAEITGGTEMAQLQRWQLCTVFLGREAFGRYLQLASQRVVFEIKENKIIATTTVYGVF